MTRRTPLDELEQLFERMSQQVDTGDWHSLGGQSITIDLKDTGDAYELTADLPGYERDEIDISIADGRLTVEADRDEEVDEEAEEDSYRYVRRERRHEHVSRSIRLPEPIDETAAVARYQNGILTVDLPKADPAAESTRINIE